MTIGTDAPFDMAEDDPIAMINAVPGLTDVGIQYTHAANENGHLGSGQRQQLRLVNQQPFGRYGIAGLLVVAEAVRDRLKRCE